MSDDYRLYKKIRCTFCQGTKESISYNCCPYCDRSGTEYVEASMKSIVLYCKERLAPEELKKLKELLDN